MASATTCCGRCCTTSRSRCSTRRRAARTLTHAHHIGQSRHTRRPCTTQGARDKAPARRTNCPPARQGVPAREA
eukprot:5967014-Prymnesium_polylepis.1